jgi:hypothetical protein
MKTPGLWLGLLIGSLACASAQVTVEVAQDQQQFLPGESLNLRVRITNLSGQVLHLGGEEDWLTFALESREGIVIPKLGEAPVVGPFILESSKVATKRVDLGPYFNITRAGTYQIVATMRIREWNREIVSPPKSFDVIQGVKLWEQEVGVPQQAGGSEPEIRRYILQQANYLRGQIRLYLRVTDQFGKPFRVLVLGPLVSFGRPEQQVDRSSNLHVLFQDGASSFTYVVCNLQGELTKHESYDYAESRPRLRPDDDGNIAVVGGTRRPSDSDIPLATTEDASAPVAASTNQLSVAKPAR